MVNAPNRSWEIYTLSDPRSFSVRYVGVSTNSQRRFVEHLSSALRGAKTHCACWIRSLLKAGMNPILAVIERGAGKSRVAAERQWIALYRGSGRLTNLTDGGDGSLGCIPTPETRAKMSAARLGKHATPETRAKMSAANRGDRCSPETRAKRSAAARNRSPEYRAKMSAALKGRKFSPEVRAKIGAAGKGRKCSPETRAKLSAAHRGRKLSLEVRAKMSAAQKGHRCAPEVRAKIAAAKKGRPRSAAHHKAQNNTAENQKEETNER